MRVRHHRLGAGWSFRFRSYPSPISRVCEKASSRSADYISRMLLNACSASIVRKITWLNVAACGRDLLR